MGVILSSFSASVRSIAVLTGMGAVAACSPSADYSDPSAVPAGYSDGSTKPAVSAPSCAPPACFDTEGLAIVAAGTDPNALIRLEPSKFTYVHNLAYAVPRLERKDAYEPKADYLKRVRGSVNGWRLGTIGPDTRLLIGGGKAYTSYDADKRTLTISESPRPDAVFLEGDSNDHTETYGNFDRKVYESSSSGIWFMNRAYPKDRDIDGSCVLDYPARRFAPSSIKIELAPEQARMIEGKVTALYVASFRAPDVADRGEWCATGVESEENNALVSGGALTARNSQRFINMRLHQMVITDGQTVLWSKSFD